jgi:protein disulfide-isomerase A1
LDTTPFAYIFTNTECNDLDAAHLSSLALKYRGRLQFSIAPAERVLDIMEDMHLDLHPSTLPAFAIREPVQNLRYPMPTISSDVSSTSFLEAVEVFVAEFLANKLNPTIKSEPIPPPSSSALIKVVGTTYDAIVNDPNRDVLLTICIEQCPPCHRLYPVLEEVAELYRAEEADDGKGEGMKKTTIATVLCDRNDIPLRRLRAFPTILMFPAKGKGKPVRFFGERTVGKLRGFVEENRGL